MFYMTKSRELDMEQRQDADVNKRHYVEDVKFYQNNDMNNNRHIKSEQCQNYFSLFLTMISYHDEGLASLISLCCIIQPEGLEKYRNNNEEVG